MGSEKGEVAVIDIETNGIVQRIQAPYQRSKVQQIVFQSETLMIVLYTGGGGCCVDLYSPQVSEWSEIDRKVEKKGEEKTIEWRRVKSLKMKDHSMCCMELR